MNKYIGDLSLFMILLSLLFLPVGTFGLAEVNDTEQEVLSIQHIRTERIIVVESTASTDEKIIILYR
jgi:hypothetical protein